MHTKSDSIVWQFTTQKHNDLMYLINEAHLSITLRPRPDYLHLLDCVYYYAFACTHTHMRSLYYRSLMYYTNSHLTHHRTNNIYIQLTIHALKHN